MTFREARRILKEISEALKIISLKWSCLQICKKEGLNRENTDIMMAVIQAESGWNPLAIGKNTDGSWDYGIIQANSYWYIKKMKLLTKWEALHNPKKAMTVMAKRIKMGRITDWSAYKNGSYRKFLKVV